MTKQVKSNSANYNSFAKYKDDLIKVFARINSNDNLYDQQHMESKAITLEIQEKFKSFRFTDFHSPFFKNKDGQGGWIQGTKDAQHWEPFYSELMLKIPSGHQFHAPPIEPLLRFPLRYQDQVEDHILWEYP